MRGHRRHAHQCCISLLSTKISTSPATALFALCTPFPSISVPPNPPLIVTFPLVRNPFVLPPLFHVYILRMRSQLSHKRQYLSMGKNISCTFLSNRRCPMQSLNPQTWRKTHGNIRGVFKSAGNICTAAAFPSLLTHFQIPPVSPPLSVHATGLRTALGQHPLFKNHPLFPACRTFKTTPSGGPMRWKKGLGILRCAYESNRSARYDVDGVWVVCDK